MLHELYPREFHEAMRAIGQRRGLRAPVVGLTVFGYRLASALRSRVAPRSTDDDSKWSG
jgi:hypothetical protein